MIAFMVRDVMALHGVFSILPLAVLKTYGVFTDLSLNIKTSVLWDRNFILCFNS